MAMLFISVKNVTLNGIKIQDTAIGVKMSLCIVNAIKIYNSHSTYIFLLRLTK